MTKGIEKKQTSELDKLIVASGRKLHNIAEDMDISVNYLYKLRKKPKKMDAEKMVQLAKAINVPAGQVFEAIKNF